MTTIGQEAHKLAVEYKELYEILRKDKDKAIQARAAGLAKADLVCKKIVAEFALKELEEHIAKVEGVQE